MVTEASYVRGGSAVRAQQWLDSADAQAWLNEYFPITTNASPVPQGSSTPDASPTGAPTLSSDRIVSRSETGRPEEAQAFFESRGWTKEQAAGIVGNLVVESGLRTDAVGDGGRAYGIAQWHADRQSVFRNQYGKDIRQSTFQEQLDYVDWELRNTEARAGNMLRGATTAEEAAAIVDKNYERSAGYHLQERQSNAAAIAAGDYSKVTTGGADGYDSGGGIGSALMELTKGAIEAISNIMTAGAGEFTLTKGSQLAGFNTEMKPSTKSTAGSMVSSTDTTKTKTLSNISTQLQNQIDMGKTTAAQAALKPETSGQKSLRNASADGTLECLDPNYPGTGGIEGYLQYYRLAA